MVFILRCLTYPSFPILPDLISAGQRHKDDAVRFAGFTLDKCATLRCRRQAHVRLPCGERKSGKLGISHAENAIRVFA